MIALVEDENPVVTGQEMEKVDVHNVMRRPLWDQDEELLRLDFASSQ